MADIQLVFEDNLNAVNRRLTRVTRNAERINTDRLSRSLSRSNQSATRLSRSMGVLRAGAVAAAAAAAAIAAAMVTAGMASLRAADQITLITNQLRAAGQSAGQAAGSIQLIAQIAADTRSDINATGALFARVNRIGRQFGRTQQQNAVFTRAVQQAFVISGASAQEATNATIQLSQGLQSGALRGDELRSVLEGAPRIIEAIAAQLGVSVGEIRELGAQGRITSEVVFAALENQARNINDEFRETNATFGQSLQVLRNGVTLVGAELGNALNDTLGINDALIATGNYLTELVTSGRLRAGLVNFINRVSIAAARIRDFFQPLVDFVNRAYDITVNVIGTGAYNALLSLIDALDRAYEVTVDFVGTAAETFFEALRVGRDFTVDLASTALEAIVDVFKSIVETFSSISSNISDLVSSITNFFTRPFALDQGSDGTIVFSPMEVPRQRRNTGGYVSGPGSGTSDSIPALLSNGEFVVRASQTRKHLALLRAINNGTQGFARGGLVGFQEGGLAVSDFLPNVREDRRAAVTPAITSLIDELNRLQEAMDELSEAGREDTHTFRALEASQIRAGNALNDLVNANGEFARQTLTVSGAFDMLRENLSGIFGSIEGFGQAILSDDALMNIDRSFVSGLNTALTGALREGSFTNSIRDAFLNTLTQAIIQASVQSLTSSLFAGLGAGGGVGITALLGFANGGRPPVGQPSIVGERGPELFIPDTAGTIVANRNLMGGATVNQTINMNITGDVTEQTRQIIQEEAVVIADNTRQIFNEQRVNFNGA